uniref:RRM domain-containing protein n=1 Tax=Pyxicephalus adspersus TaxID=30357 RepID=A0AAV3B1E4_PYXAD|nr:TPA: hypothetical protein GDO54_006805 [Pyxicephalus adspersus]
MEPGEEPLSLDFPEIDLSQLDAGDFDTNSCFNELQWCNDQSENDSNQYGTDDSELFQIIYGDNEALLEALTQTLDDIQEDEISLSAFMSSGDGDFCPAPALSPKPCLPSESFKSLETEDELSILKKLLLSPAQTPTGFDANNDSSYRQAGITKLRPHRQCIKVESSLERQTGVPHSRGCTELQRHLVSAASISPAKDDNHDSNKEEESYSTEEDHSEDESGRSSPLPDLQSQESQFTCEREKQAVVDLIRYMHTYCLPPRKHHSDEKHQHCTGLLKRPKTESSPSVHSCSNQVIKVNPANAKGKFSTQGKCQRTKPTWTGSSILKVLLAKDICGDVSKPYRLARPVYAAFTDSSCRHVVQEKMEQGLRRGNKTEFEKYKKPYLSLRREGRYTETDSGRPAHNASEQMTNKSALKQECSVYAVRRSSRLNPEFWFNDDVSPQTCTAQADVNAHITMEQSLCLTTGPFVDEEQVAEVEVEESVESTGQVAGDRTLEDLLEMDAREAHSEIDIQETPSYDKRNFDQGLSVELCGTAGLTPPTTPPYKPAEEDLFKPEIHQDSVNNDPLITSPKKMGVTEKHPSLNRRLSKKQPERTELFAHLSRTASVPDNPLSQGIKRPLSRSFGDHDYCQVKRSEPVFQRKVIKSLDLTSYDDRKQKHIVPPVLGRKMSSSKEENKLLKDHEIRASLTKHFGSPDNTLKKEEDNVTCTSPEYDSAFEDSESESSFPEDDVCFSPLRKKSYNLDEGWVIVIKNLSNSINAYELKKRFEVFGEILECQVHSKNSREKYGFITYRWSEHAALSLKKGPSLRKKNEPIFHMSYEGPRHVFRTKYRHPDCCLLHLELCTLVRCLQKIRINPQFLNNHYQKAGHCKQ